MRRGFGQSNNEDRPVAVSIVIPVYVKEKRVKFLTALSSLLMNRITQPSEIIIVVNGKLSTEELIQSDIYRMSEKIGLRVLALSYLEDKRYENIDRPKNIFTARQMGVEKANGDIILAGDIDNIFSTNWIYAYWRAFNNDPNLLMAYGPTGLHGTIGIIGKFMTCVSTIMKGMKILINFPPFAGHNHGIRRDIIKKIPGLYSDHILVHENEIPIVVAKARSLTKNKGYVKCLPDAIVSTDFSKHKQSLKGGVKWFLEATNRNISQIMRLYKK